MDEGFDKVQDLVDTYKDNSLLEVELLNEQTVENLDEQVVDNVQEIIEHQVIGTVNELEEGQEIILQQQEVLTLHF